MSTPTSCTRWSGARWVLPLIAFVLLALPAGLFAQDNDPIENSSGTTYVVAFPDTTKNTFDARYPNTRYEDKCFFFIYSGVDNVISIKGRGYQRSGLAIPGGRFTIVDLMGSENRAPNPIVFEHCKPVDNTFRIEAESPIVVYQYMATKFGAEAWTAIPVEAWGNEYYAAATPGEIGSDVSPGGEFDYNRKNKAFPAEILVISAYDDTKITIVPNGQVQNFCNPTSITLKAGEAYQIQSWVDTLTANVGGDQPDFAGSRIFSTKPVGVISGTTRAQTIDENIGLGKNIFKNMLIEWVAPVEQHGTEFVYMPSWDGRRPTGAPQEDPAEKRKAEFVRIYGTHESPSGTQGFFMQGGVPIPYDKAIEQGKFNEVRHTPNLARVHKTDMPAQAMMHSAAVVKYAGTTNGFGGYIGAAYDGWGGYMVELTPREQWVTFAPYYSSTHPAGMEHFINLVVDTNHVNDVYTKNGGNFIFQRRIEGTDLIWGSMSVQPGIDNWVEGKNGAKFAGFVYGTLVKGGHEEYRPGQTRRDDKNPPTGINRGNGGDDGESEVLHPSEYEEYLAIAYGYPLAPSRLVVGEGDSLGIKTILDCNGLTIEIESLNENPVGLRSIRLDGSKNSKIISQNPFPITGAIKATVKVGPINPREDASATIVIKDKTGKITRVEFTYYAEKIELDPTQLIFGLMTPGLPKTMTVKATNPLGRAITVKNIRLIQRNPAFSIKSPTAFPLTIPANSFITITVEANPTEPDKEYIDTVEIELECTKWKVPVKAETANPCLNMNDLDFGTLGKGEPRTLPLRICNDGGGEVTFNNPAGGAVIEWLLANFTVSAADIQRVKDTTLTRGICITIMVTFSSPTVGNYSTTARFWASTRRCRDTSVWIARVNEPGPQITGYDWQEQWIVKGACSPADNPKGTKNRTAEYVSTIYAYNTGDRNFTVTDIRLAGADSIYFELGKNPTYPDEIKINDLIRPFDSVSQTPKALQTVIFRPGPEERIYTCEVVLVSDDARAGEVRSTLRGIGIESHVQAQASSDFGRHLFVTGASGQTNDIVIRTDGTRDVTITDVFVVPDNAASAGQFTVVNRAALLKTHPKNDVFLVTVQYAPTAPGDHSGTLMVTGDFSPCDDSTTAIAGKAYTLSARPWDVQLGTILTCFDSTGQVYLENDGSDPIQLVSVTPAHGPEFSVAVAALPVTIAPGERYPIDVTFSPSTTAPPGPTFSGTLTFDVRDVTGLTPVLFNGGPVVARFTGTAEVVVLNAHINKTYTGLPGKKHIVDVFVDDSKPNAKIDELTFSLRYRHGMMRDEIDFTNLDALVQGTIIPNWKVIMPTPTAKDPMNDTLTVVFLDLKAPPGEYLIGTGSILKIPFITYIGDQTTSELPFFLTPKSRLECANIITTPGQASLDSVCGLNFRLISAFDGATYAFQQNNPNPFNPTTNINFSLGLDGETSVRVYDANGKQVALLVNSYLKPGNYSVTWDASTMPSGVYYCRIVSGAWGRTQTMMLQK